MDSGQPARARIAHRIAPFAVGPDKAPGLDRQGAAQQRQAEILALAAALAVVERGGDAVGGERRGEIVEHRAEYELRRVGRAALEHGDAAEALQDLVEPALVAERSLVAITGNRAIDEARIDLAQPRIVDAEARRHRGPEILDQHV